MASWRQLLPLVTALYGAERFQAVTEGSGYFCIVAERFRAVTKGSGYFCIVAERFRAVTKGSGYFLTSP